jgi:hypothetical protein
MYRSLFFLFLSFIFVSCKFNPNLQGMGSGEMQGIWEEDSVIYQDSLSQYTQHSIRFSCDSFYMTLKTTSKTRINPDSCYNNGVWMEYLKGTYTLKGDTLQLLGTFTKSNFKQKISGCYRIGTYKPVFVIDQYSEKEMRLHNLSTHFPVLLKLKERTTCTPKPL